MEEYAPLFLCGLRPHWKTNDLIKKGNKMCAKKIYKNLKRPKHNLTIAIEKLEEMYSS